MKALCLRVTYADNEIKYMHYSVVVALVLLSLVLLVVRVDYLIFFLGAQNYVYYSTFNKRK